MMRKYLFLVLGILLFAYSCSPGRKAAKTSAKSGADKTYSTTKTFSTPLDINRKEFLSYAKTFMGTPYKYGSSNPAKGFDCSGFVYHVLTKFNVKPPRSSYEYGHVGKKVSVKNARPGDLILFTGSNKKRIGHMGIVTENQGGKLKFIHSATSRNVGVIISEFSGYYKDHFVKIISILK